jgi:photosystem II stability/assembly factor-like uncharacterized protein
MYHVKGVRMISGRFGRVLWCGILFMVVFHGEALPAGRPQVRDARSDIVPGVVIVAMQEGTSSASAMAQGNQAPVSAFRLAGVLASRQMFAPVFAVHDAQRAAALAPLGRIFECAIAPDADPRAIAAQLARLPGVAYAEPKYLQTLCDIPNDPGLTNQNAAFTRMNAFAGYTIAKGSASVLIATIDGGTHWRHEDLLPNVRINSAEDVNHNGVFDAADNNGIDDDANGFIDDVVGWNFANGTNDPTGLTSMPQSYAHGTATASHFGAASNNGVGMAGSSWNCALLPVCAGSAVSDNAIAYGYEGIVYAAARGAAVINCSWGRLGGFSRFEQDVITSVTNGGALVVAAAGNDNANVDLTPHYPACYNDVLAVGATASSSDARASFTNYGTNIPVYAPGVSIWSAFTNGLYGDGGSGTSYSSPLVAGLAGILKAAHPTYTPSQIAAQIRATADPIESVNPGYTGMLGKGRVNFARALSENNPAVAVISSTVRASDGRSYFIPGDTVLVTVTIRNPLFLNANTITFTSTSASGLVTPMDVPGAVSSLAPDQSIQLASFRFTVGAVPAVTNTVLRVRWSIDGSNGDGFAVPVTLFPTAPQWIMQVDGSDAAMFSVHAVSSSIVWASGGSGTATLPMVLRSTDGGSSWAQRTGDLSGVDLYCVSGLDANRAWVGTGDGKIFATTNGGANWVQQSYPGTQSPFIDGIRIFADGTGYALGDPEGSTGRFVVLKTTDFGGTWAHTVNEPQGAAGEAGWNNSFWWTDTRHGWFGTNKSKVWRTTNSGTTWSSSAVGSANSYGVSFRDTLTGYAIHDAGYVARSTNGGQTWAGILSPTISNITAVAAAPGSPAVWVTTAGNLFHSRNEGGAWATEAMYPFIGSLNHVSFVDTSTGWVVTSYGEVLKYSAPVVTGVAEGGTGPLPPAYALLRNYPNPFNGSSRIVYTIPGVAAFRITLRVFDLLGREVGLLADGVQDPGEHRVEFDAHGHASGVYLCVLDAVPVAGGAGFRLTRSMILLR